ncbi:MAG: hypothetical protein JWO94_3376, partial [Verrucomicrobiaceae bacterium]|nr:hypothetical protein [Verrucomicrobiaceae bacterium]
RIIIDLRFSENDIYDEHSKDNIGENTIHTVNETATEFHSSQTVQIVHDSEGLSFLVLDDPQKSVQGQTSQKLSGRSTHHSFPDGPDYPFDVTAEQGSSHGAVDAEQSGGANITPLNEGRDLMVSLGAAFKLGDSTYRQKTISHHWEGVLGNERRLKEDVTVSDQGPLPAAGGTQLPGFTLRPDKTALPEGVQPDPAGDFQSNTWYGAKTVKRPKGGYSVTCSGTIKDPEAEEQSHASTPEKSVSHTHYKTINATITIIPGPKPAGELVMEPVDGKAYDDWVPTPVCESEDIQKLYGDFQTLAVKATIKSKDPKKPAPAAPMDFYLTDVSKHTGRCGNEPKTAGPDPKPGLRFSKNQGAGVHVDEGNPQHAYIISDVTEGTVVIEALDAGAYGKLQVTADASDLIGTYERTGEKHLLIPRDDNGNHIADAWEQKKNIFDKNYPATWDEDNVPNTGFDNRGDGLTLYEEYRGFVTGVQVDPSHEERVWQRLEPAVKKLFVYPQGDDNLLFKAGSRLYESVTGTKVYFIFDDYGVAKDDLGTTRYVTRWFNFNSNTNDGVDFKGRQFAVVIQNDNEARIFTKSAPDEEAVNMMHRAPEQVEAIHINHAYVQKAIEDYCVLFPPSRPLRPTLDPKQVPTHPCVPLLYMQVAETLKGRASDVHLESLGARMAAHETELIGQYITFSVLHELGHATGAIHHDLMAALNDSPAHEDKYYSDGDPDCAMRYWDTDERTVIDNFELRLRFFSGLWNPAAVAPSGKPWHFCNKEECKPGMHLIKK